jgi:hypothetical protein
MRSNDVSGLFPALSSLSYSAPQVQQDPLGAVPSSIGSLRQFFCKIAVRKKPS